MKYKKTEKWYWYLFDAGNSAHALLVSTVGFALYFRQHLFVTNNQADSLWAIVTAITLTISAALSPFLTSYLQHHRKRWLGLLGTTLGSVFFTILLGFDLHVNAGIVVSIYVASAIGYYLALPIYTSYLEESAGDHLEQSSSSGWAIGYLGGIVAVAIALASGSLNASITDNPAQFRQIFIIAGLFNLVFSLPMLIIAWSKRGSEQRQTEKWKLEALLDTIRSTGTARLLISYWMVGEAATITLYFTAIFLTQYVGLPVKTVFILTLGVQLIAAISTYCIGKISSMNGSATPFIWACIVWIIIPPTLWAVKFGVPYWIPLSIIGLVLGAHHVLVRAEIVRISKNFDASKKGAIFGFLEVSGRASSIAGPLIAGTLALAMELSEALLIASVFPVVALFAIKKYKWKNVF